MVTSSGLKTIILLIVLSVVVFLTGYISSVSALKVNITVSPKVGANYYFVNKTSGPVQKFYLAWENSGSVGCKALPRITFYNSSSGDRVYTAWAERRELWPGDKADWLFYSMLPPGNYTGKVKILYCKEIFRYGPYELEVENYSKPESNVLKIAGNKTFKNYLELTLTSNKTLKDVVVVPTEYPMGWAFGSKKLDKLEKKEKVKLYYEPSIWKQSKVKIKAMTMNGKYAATKEVLLKRERKGFWERVLLFFSNLISI